MAGTVYSKRDSLFVKQESEWRITGDALVWRDGRGAESSFPWRDIVGVRLAYAPTRFKTWRHMMELRLRDGAKWTIDNTHFKGFADFEDRSASYAPFVREVVGQIREKSPDARATVGAAAAMYWISIVGLSIVFALLAFVFLALPIVEFPGMVWVKLGIIAFFLPTLFVWAKKAFPRGMTLDRIPEDALPKVVSGRA